MFYVASGTQSRDFHQTANRFTAIMRKGAMHLTLRL